jgi:hypothetical protein
MRNGQYRDSEQFTGKRTAACGNAAPDPSAPGDWVAAAAKTLNEMAELVPPQCVANPDALTEDRVTAYALALIRLRECASAAGLERLMKACDALAVTVARLIEDRGCACREKCEALRRFVVHAKTMIRMSTEGAMRHAQRIPVAASA